MANVKLNEDKSTEIVRRFENGEDVASLAVAFNVHETTIRRCLNRMGKSLYGSPSSPNSLDLKCKAKLLKVLSKHNIENIEALITDLEAGFFIEPKTEKDYNDYFPVIELEEV